MSKKLLNLAFISLAALSPQVLAAYDQTGCFSSPGDLTLATTSPYMSLGMCKAQCQEKNTSVAAVQGTDCYCGKSLPPSDTRVSNKECDMACPGYPRDFCGGSKTWTFMADQIPAADVSDSKETTSLTVNPTVVQTATAIQGLDSTATIPANILTAPAASFTKNPGVADTSSAASSATAAADSAAASSSSASASAASPTLSSGATGTLVRSVGAGSVVGAVLIPLAMSWF